MTTNSKSISDNFSRYPETRLFWFGKQIVVPQKALMGNWTTLASTIQWARELSFGWQTAGCLSPSLSIEDACKIAATLDNNRSLSMKFRSADFWLSEVHRPPLGSDTSSLRWVLHRIYGKAHVAQLMPILLTAMSECGCFEDVWDRFEDLIFAIPLAASGDESEER